jgi:thiamine biosynthesis protein ThiS
MNPPEVSGAVAAAAGTLTLTVNGDVRDIPRGSSVRDLLRSLDLDPRMVVVELNRGILRDRDAFADVALADGDTVELVHFVGGG